MKKYKYSRSILMWINHLILKNKIIYNWTIIKYKNNFINQAKTYSKVLSARNIFNI